MYARMVRMPSQLQVFVLPVNFDSDGITSHAYKNDLAPVKDNLKRPPQGRFFRGEFHQDRNHFRG